MDILSLARQAGKIKDQTLDHLCDGGAQLLHSIGKEKYKEMYGNDGGKYALSTEGDAEIQQLLAMNDGELLKMHKEVYGGRGHRERG